MSYPEPRYTGDKGEISAAYRPTDTPPDIRSGNGSTHYLATGEGTDGEFGLYKVQMGPKAPGPGTHFHRAISESFFVLDGEVTIFDGDRWVACRPGDFLYVPVGGLHAFKNASADPASMLLLFTPGGPREEYFERVAEVAQRGPEELKEFRIRHDSYFVEDFEN